MSTQSSSTEKSPSAQPLLAEVSRLLSKQQVDVNLPMVLGISGGVDSMVLAEVMLRLKVKVHLLHVNYHQRGEESEQDALFITQWADEKKMPLKTVDYTPIDSGNFQEDARTFRYQEFRNYLKEVGGGYILTAHHLDDSLESVLLNLTRGTGITGLRGIRPKRDNIVRPFAFCFKKQILAFAQENDIPWRQDSSNLTNKYRRNQLRNEVIPGLKNVDFRMEKSFSKTMQNLQQESDFLFEVLDSELDKVCVFKENIEELSAEALMKLKHPFLVVRHWVRRHNCDLENEVFELLEKERGKRIISDAVIFERSHSGIICFEEAINNFNEIEIQSDQKEIPLKIGKLKCSILDTTSEGVHIIRDKDSAMLDFDKLEFPLKLRVWEDGEKFQPVGMSGSKLVSDFLKDEKVPTSEKKKVLVLTSSDEIVWVVGYRISNRFKVVEDTKKIYFVRP